MSQSPAVALVTGAAKRIGRALALDLARAGWRVAVHYQSSATDATELVEAIEQAGGRAVALAADLADEAEITRLAAAAAALGPLTLLVNNAAIFEYDQPASVTRASWDRHMAINLRAPLVLTQGLLAHLPDDHRANVINLIDQRVLNLTPHYTSYSVSKAGLWALTQHLARALAPRVRVNAIGPGPVMAHPRMSAQEFDALARAMPLRRAVEPEEICRALRFILDSPAMTGQMITIDSGQHLGWLSPGQVQARE